MTDISEKIAEWTRTKFSGLSHDELRQAGSVLGCNFGPNTSDKTMRLRLCEKVGELPPADVVDQAPPANAPPPAPVKMIRMNRPRLAPGDAWEGRRRRVIVHKAPQDEKHIAFQLYWNFVCRSFKYDEQIDMPQPYFEILRSSKITRVVQTPIKDSDGNRIGTDNRDVATPRFSYVDMGWTPGTENLPGSILEYWQNEAKQKNYFRSLLTKQSGRNTLIQISADLMGSKGPAYYKDLTNEDIWQEVIRFLGFEDQFYVEDDEEVTA